MLTLLLPLVRHPHRNQVLTVLSLAQFILETGYPPSQIILHLSSINARDRSSVWDELRQIKVVRLMILIRLCINTGKQKDDPSRRIIHGSSTTKTSQCLSSSVCPYFGLSDEPPFSAQVRPRRMIRLWYKSGHFSGYTTDNARFACLFK